MNIYGDYDPIRFGVQIGCILFVLVGLIALSRIFIQKRKDKKFKMHFEPRRIEVDVDMDAIYVINGKRWRMNEMSMVQSGIHNEERLTLTLDRVGS